MADAAAAVATNALPLRPFSEDEFVNLGLEMRGNATAKGWKNLKHSSQIDLFKSTYGPHPLAVSLIWMDLQRSPFQADRIDDSVEPKHLLVMYRWLKSYESEKELYSNFGFPVKNIRKWCDDLSKKVALLRKIKVRRTKLNQLYSLECTHVRCWPVDRPQLGRRRWIGPCNDRGWHPLRY
jgi:hypothetical protein